MEVNSLHSWKLKWTIVNEAASIQGYRPARSALLPASNAGVTSYLTSSYNFRNFNNIIKTTDLTDYYNSCNSCNSWSKKIKSNPLNPYNPLFKIEL